MANASRRSQDLFVGELDRLTRFTSAHVDWDDAAGEDWARFLDGDLVVGYLSRKIPLLFGDSMFRGVVGVPVVYVEARSEDPVLWCDASVLHAAFGHCPRLAGLNSNSFSPDDLWYATV
ncbi:hypothetical protein Rhe02_33480 [Rhizocola hellebori]|uniref:Uncharacterized protein n=1 Tax=Rhizocola hellebori TaxID=1392758 RepID=A0A8J3Q7I9_9ACTN|nr:hypothetical protein Rhe02_33480 [Rhizocola hellebori]